MEFIIDSAFYWKKKTYFFFLIIYYLIKEINFYLKKKKFFFLGTLSTITNELWTGLMPWTLETCLGLWPLGRTSFSFGLSRRCCWMLWIAFTSRAFTHFPRWQWCLWIIGLYSTSTLCYACHRTECMQVWRQFRTIAIYTGMWLFIISQH